MITTYLPYVFGVTSFLLGLFMFLALFKIYKPKYKNEQQKIKIDNLHAKYGTILKIISVVLILRGGYTLLNPTPDRYKMGSIKEMSRWTSDARNILITNCNRDAGPKAKIYPIETNEYCECSTDKIMEAFTQKEYEVILQRPQEEQLKLLLPVFQDCLTELRKRTDSIDSKQE